MNKFFILLFATVLWAKEVYINGTKYVYLDKHINKSENKECFFKNGIIDNRNCYINSGFLIISLKDSSYVQLLSKEYNLTFSKHLFKDKYLFKVNNKENTLNVLNSIEKKYHFKVEINWIRPRVLR